MTPASTALSPEQTQIAELLRERIGLDPEMIGTAAMIQAIRQRMRHCDIVQTQTYRQYLHTSATELQELIETVVVPETWFFRNREAYDLLTQLAIHEVMSPRACGPLRILSLPCSTGEEPYSITMALLQSSLSPESFAVDAVDISRKALEQAKRARYGANSFRGQELEFRDRYFEYTGDSYQFAPTMPCTIRFLQGNLHDPNFQLGAGTYDIIFCRNMLIYMERTAQNAALKKLKNALVPDGVLFLGPAEAFLVRAHGFSSLERTGAFAFHKSRVVVAPPNEYSGLEKHTIARQATRTPVRLRHIARHPPAPHATRPLLPTEPITSSPSSASLSDLETARHFADAGRLAEAAAICDAHLQRHKDCAIAYYLSGLILDAQSKHSEAAVCYRKTLYLEPTHSEAALQLALLAQKQGDVASARRMKARARRLGKQTSP